MKTKESVSIVSILIKNIASIAWLQAFLAMAGSLYFSEIQHLPPCLLCWYQRIVMYPLVVILAVGILRNDKKNLPYYVLPLSSIGWLIAFYQVLLQAKILPERIAPCTTGVSCTTVYGLWLGFITIPILSLAAFTLITLCMIIALKYQRTNNI